VTTKLFPFKKLNSNGNLESCEIDYPQNGMKVGNILYQTENMNIGLLKPNTAEITNKYYPRNARFTKAETGNYYTINNSQKIIEIIVWIAHGHFLKSIKN